MSFQHDGHYVCECGREFIKSQSYNAHLSHCKDHLSKDSYEKRLKQQKVASDSGNRAKKEKARLRQAVKQSRWSEEIHFCENCGKVLPSNFKKVYGSGRFCSINCSSIRVLSLKTKDKIARSCNITPWHCKRSLNGYYKGIYCASSYELIYLVYMLDHNIKIKRCDKTYIYHYKGKEHVYLPDFYLEETDTVIEIKGQHTEVVDIKASSVKDSLYKILYEKDLKEYWNYCKNKYKVKNYRKLCELLYNK